MPTTLTIPAHMLDALTRYIDHGCLPGHFLTAVLSNDLKAAVASADATNQALLPVYVQWLYTHAPFSCWGSPARVEAWITERRVVTD